MAADTRGEMPHSTAHDILFGVNSPRRYPMKVIVCGLGRTGTTSMQHALGILGFPMYHAEQIRTTATTEHVALWNRAMAAKYIPWSSEKPLTRLEWDEILGEHMGVVDVPAAWFGPELAELYPEAKVIVITREKESWFKSCVAAFQHRRGLDTWWWRPLYEVLFFWLPHIVELLHFQDRKQIDVWKFEWHAKDAKPKAIKAYDDYYAEVREESQKKKGSSILSRKAGVHRVHTSVFQSPTP